MPNALDYFRTKERYLRVFLYGHAKTKKTWWCGRAAEAGFNTLFIDTDRGSTILKNLTDKALARTHIIPCADRGSDPVAYQFLSEFARTFDVYYHEKRGATSRRPMGDAIHYDFRAPGEETVIVLDSWTATVRSLIQEFSNRNKVDPADAGRVEWDGYRWAGMMATWLIEQLKSLPCHLIIIGHQTTYEKWQGKGQNRKMIFSREQPQSTSNPHGQTLAAHFDEVYRFFMQGTMIKIDTGGHSTMDGGSRLIPPGVYNWEELSLPALLKKHGIPLPGDEGPTRTYAVATTGKPTPLVSPAKPQAATPSVPAIVPGVQQPKKLPLNKFFSK